MKLTNIKQPLQFHDYKGGSGPTEAVINLNNRSFADALTKLGIAVEYGFISLRTIEFAKTQKESDWPPVVQFKIKEKSFTVGYDRWGFVCDQDDNLDQAGWIETMKWLEEKLYVKS